ncbi:hypothetical protein BH09MYX1_BH09MYX1_42500 [soil metagenome]
MATLPDLFASPFTANAHAAVRTIEAAPDAVAKREFTDIYARLAPPVQRFLRDVLRDDALAWDATQETFARAYAHLEVLRDEARARPWLFGVARNVSLELRRSRHRAGRLVKPESGELERAVATGACPESECLGREAIRVIDAALLQLSEDRRSVLLLRLDHGLAYDEIASLMGWSLAKVKVEIFRAREVLRAVMEDYDAG